MTDKTTIQNREAWLIAATDKLRATFTRAGKTIPPVAIACGWPSSGGLGKKKKVLGECWDGACAADGRPQIFISPNLDNELHCTKPVVEGAAGDFMGVLPTLAHELVHAVEGIPAGHGAKFKKTATAIGLEGKATSTHAGAQLVIECEEIVKILGPYPNSKINPSLKGGKKKQGTRMLKCTCADEACGFTVRTTKKWLLDVGAPHCPKHGAMLHDPIVADEEEGEGEDGE